MDQNHRPKRRKLHAKAVEPTPSPDQSASQSSDVHGRGLSPVGMAIQEAFSRIAGKYREEERPEIKMHQQDSATSILLQSLMTSGVVPGTLIIQHLEEVLSHDSDRICRSVMEAIVSEKPENLTLDIAVKHGLLSKAIRSFDFDAVTYLVEAVGVHAWSIDFADVYHWGICTEIPTYILRKTVAASSCESERASFVKANQCFALRWACVLEDLDLVRSIVQQFGLTAQHIRSVGNDALRCICIFGDVARLALLVEELGFDLSLDDLTQVRDDDDVPPGNVGRRDYYFIVDRHRKAPFRMEHTSAVTAVPKFNGLLLSGEPRLSPADLLCNHGHIEMLQYLLRRVGSFRAHVASHASRYIAFACENMRHSMVEFLCEELQLTSDIFQQDGGHALAQALEYSSEKTVQYLVDYFKLTAEKVRSFGSNLLAQCCRQGLRERAAYLVEMLGLTAQDARAQDYEALRNAAKDPSLRTVVYLVVALGLTADDVRANRNCVLRKCVENSRLDLVTFLINTVGLGAEDVRANHLELISVACKAGSVLVLKYLIKVSNVTAEEIKMARADVIPLNHPGSPLHCACLSQCTDMVQFLVEHFEYTSDDAKGSFRGNNPVDALLSVPKNKVTSDTLKFLYAKGLVRQEDAQRALWKVCCTGDYADVSVLHATFQLTRDDVLSSSHPSATTLESSTSSSTPLTDEQKSLLGLSPFLAACASGRLNIVRYLVEQCGVTAEDVKAGPRSALRWACDCQHFEVVKYLVQAFNL